MPMSGVAKEVNTVQHKSTHRINLPWCKHTVPARPGLKVRLNVVRCSSIVQQVVTAAAGQ